MSTVSPTASFPEGVLVRSTSALYKPYGVGRVMKVRADHAKVEFNPSEYMEPAYRSEDKVLCLADVKKEFRTMGA